uniref:Non-lysosomal glucosylceramidase n=4 Tax=Lygus hesperus TaxID=30085 RepID=A0A0A9Z3A6_LYGHE
MGVVKDDKDSWTDPSSVPPYGWKARSDYKFPQKRKQKLDITFHQMRVLLPLILRYVWYTIKLWFKRMTPVMDFVNIVQNKEKSGVPLGGIGAGSIGRGFKGEFCRFQMDPGNYKYEDVIANQFIVTVYDEQGNPLYQKVLSTFHKPGCFDRALSSWDWTFPASNVHYTALYPRAWYMYDVVDKAHNIDIKLTCHQISPVIPHNYEDSSHPACVFEWFIENNSSSSFQVSLTMSMRDGDGSSSWFGKSYKTSEDFELSSEDGVVLGVTIRQKIAGVACNYSIASKQDDQTIVKRCLFFDPSGNGKTFWNAIPTENFENFSCDGGKKNLGCAVKSLVKLKGFQNNSSICFALAWDMPKIHFPYSPGDHLRYYTKFFGSDCDAGPKICRYALNKFKVWTKEIYNWQQTILADKKLPDWYKSAIFNELYYVSDGGTNWLVLDDEEAEKLPDDDPRKLYGRFAYLEGHEYRMYNTYDVHFYASFALAMLWPGLQKSLQYDFKDSIPREDNTIIEYLFEGTTGPRKVKDSIPHDLGDPNYNPFNIINIYPIHDVSEWKDLNVKFVLQVYRDFTLTKDHNYLRDMYPQVVVVMNRSLRWDPDHLGVIQNDGFPDQTYDTWVMLGVSAYCGSLFIAAVQATVKMAKIMEDNEVHDKFKDILERGKVSFDEKLWNGKYFIFDSSGDVYSDTIMSDQLCGLWYLRSCNDEDEVFPRSHVQSALKTIYDHNVLMYYDGTQGAVNGMRPNGDVDRIATQSEESWTGVTYALASLFIFEGMMDEGFNTARGLYETIFEKSGLGFATPEALHGLDSYRAVGYMRPLSIWSIQHAIELQRAKGLL